MSEGDVNESRKTCNLVPKTPEKIAESKKQINNPDHATLNSYSCDTLSTSDYFHEARGQTPEN